MHVEIYADLSGSGNGQLINFLYDQDLVPSEIGAIDAFTPLGWEIATREADIAAWYSLSDVLLQLYKSFRGLARLSRTYRQMWSAHSSSSQRQANLNRFVEWPQQTAAARLEAEQFWHGAAGQIMGSIPSGPGVHEVLTSKTDAVSEIVYPDTPDVSSRHDPDLT